MHSTRALDVRLIQPTDMSMIAGWWKAHGWEPLPPESLPKNGLLVVDEQGPLVAAWLYRTDSAIAWLEWFVRNPDATRERMQGAIEKLVDYACLLAQVNKFKLMFVAARNDSLLRKLESAGFVVHENKTMSLLLKKL